MGNENRTLSTVYTMKCPFSATSEESSLVLTTSFIFAGSRQGKFRPSMPLEATKQGRMCGFNHHSLLMERTSCSLSRLQLNCNAKPLLVGAIIGWPANLPFSHFSPTCPNTEELVGFEVGDQSASALHANMTTSSGF